MEFWIAQSEISNLKLHKAAKLPGGVGLYFWNNVSDYSKKEKGYIKVKIKIEVCK